MELGQGLIGLAGVVVGGLITGAADFIRRQFELKQRRDERLNQRADSLEELCTQFMVEFSKALRGNEDYYEMVAVNYERGYGGKESPEARVARQQSELRFRELTWRLRVRASDPELRRMLEEVAKAFDTTFDDAENEDYVASDYPKQSIELRGKATAIIDRIQALHGARS